MRARDKDRINETIARYLKRDKPLGLLMDELMDRFGLSQTQAEDAVHTWQETQEHPSSVEVVRHAFDQYRKHVQEIKAA